MPVGSGVSYGAPYYYPRYAHYPRYAEPGKSLLSF
jgi:hypothetical protein